MARYRLALQAIDPIHLPRYPGSTLRGGLGTALKQAACRQPGECNRRCAEPELCAYGYVFETPVPAGSEVLRNLESVPRPFVLVPPIGPVDCQPGETIAFEITLIGRGMDYWPYFLRAFNCLGEAGIGAGRGRFRLDRAWTIAPLGPWETLVYDGKTDALRNENMVAQAADLEQAAAQWPTDALCLCFQTPTLLKHQGKIVQQPEFHILIRTILRRLSSLSYFHCGTRWETDYQGIIEAAKQVHVEASDISWETWERFSGRQRRQLSMSGMVGTVTFTGPVGPFRALLVAASVVHVGKNTIFGNGQVNRHVRESALL